MKGNGKPTVADRMRDTPGMLRAMREGVQQALRVHKLLGHPIAVGRDGKVLIIQPEDIQIDEQNDGAPKLPDDAIP